MTLEVPAALSVSGLRAGYGDLTAVWDVSLDARAGQVTTVLGNNGAGKTTLLKAIAGLLPSSDGKIFLGDEDISGLRPWQRARKGIGLVQEGKRVFRELTVRENLVVGLPRRIAASGLQRSLDRFPLLARFSDRPAGTLSGGQQQLLSIAQALISGPRVILIDEPSSGLSPMAFEEILQVVLEMKQVDGLAVVLVEQVVGKVLGGISDQVVVLDRGRVRLAAAVGAVTEQQIVGLILAEATPLASSERDRRRGPSHNEVGGST